ncbi:MAG: sigma-54-dependent Fis family transcriptional regulator [Betaproteobacteria bacterium]|nr:sigma-54-dependent Fis family transcriptional regulator [Betaproteobacteria bacterium]
MERRGQLSERRVLVVDDEPDIRELLELTLLKMGVGVTAVGNIGAARDALAAERFNLCLTDMRLPDGEGLDLVRHIAGMGRDLPVAVITAFGSTENAVAALKAGAFDYVSKPVGLEQLRTLIRSALALPDQVDVTTQTRHLLGESTPLKQVRELVGKLARTQAPVYVSGESGSGKELAARLIHELGSRCGGPFMPVNCGAIPDALMESEFFGYRKGAFTGADKDRDGFFQAAAGGTLFLDEVGDLPLAMQVKLLRAIQEKRVRKLGATQEEPIDVRIVSATHEDLAALVESGRFRQDLFYRLNVIELRMPALRECREDIPVIAASILRRISAQQGLPSNAIAPEALEALSRYDFPGNVRELENILERALALSANGQIETDGLQLAPLAGQTDAGDATLQGEMALPEYLDGIEREAIMSALEKTGFNRTAAARQLGVTFRSLRYRMQRLGIREPDSA